MGSAIFALWKYRAIIGEFLPLIRAVLSLMRDHKGDLDKLVARPDTRPDQDARDFLDEVVDDGFDDNRG